MLYYGIDNTIFGQSLIAWDSKGINDLIFVDNADFDIDQYLQYKRSNIILKQEQSEAKLLLEQIFKQNFDYKNISMQGTDFELEVWNALQQIPFATTVSYQEVAEMLGKSSAVRAVANAIARNKISLLIPCHRVISKSGKIHKYRWGSARKKQILDYEFNLNI